MGVTNGVTPKNRNYLSVALPASQFSDVPHLRDKSLKIGYVGRAAAVFRVDEIVIFPDVSWSRQKHDINLIATILTYMETPQYLRKRIFKIKPELRYVGVLPPLRTPHHPLSNRVKNLEVGEYREGAVVSSVKEGSLLDIGVEKMVLIPKVQLPVNTRVTVRIVDVGKRPKVVLASREETKKYWGYRVSVSKKPFGHFVRNRHFDMIIATSRHGTPIVELVDDLKLFWKKSVSTLVAFGAPTQGLYEIVAREQKKLIEVTDFIVNTIPRQGTETVRTEEALYATLALFNLFNNDTNHE